MAWPTNPRLAKSLAVLRSQLDSVAPSRDKLSDGAIGDEEHQSRDSDHNAWVKDGEVGVVTAIDITHDPAHGIDDAFVESIRASRDDRIKYIIWNRRKWTPSVSQDWRAYTGKNPHTHHVHISVKADREHYDMGKLWDFLLGRGGGSSTPTEGGAAPSPVLRKGSKGQHVEALQELLNKNGMRVVVDAQFGRDTMAAVIAFQNKHGLVADGIVGRYTWDALRGIN